MKTGKDDLPVAKSWNASGRSARAFSISYCDFASPRSSLDRPSLCKHSVSLTIFTWRSNVTIVSRLRTQTNDIFPIIHSSYPSFEKEFSTETPFVVPNAKNGNEHMLTIGTITRRASLRRNKFRNATCYWTKNGSCKKQKFVFEFTFSRASSTSRTFSRIVSFISIIFF